MHAFVAGVLLGRGRRHQVGENPEPNPPHREGGQAAERLAGEGDPVIGADAHREAISAEEPLEDGPGLDQLRAGEALTGEEHPAEPVGDRERITVDAGTELELPFVVRRPRTPLGASIVACGGPAGPGRRTRRRAVDKSEAVEVAGHGAARRPGRRRPLALDEAEQLARAPEGMMLVGLEQPSKGPAPAPRASGAAAGTDRPEPAAPSAR